MSSLRLPLRLARREVRRRPGRTALVALLVAVPVLAMALAVTLVRTDGVTPEQAWARRFGQADAVGEPTGRLPKGSRSVVVRDAFVPALTEGRRSSDLQLSDHPLLDPIMVGFASVVEGRAPTGDRDLALSRTAARELGVRMGDELVLTRPAERLKVVGLVEEVDCISCRTAIVAPAAMDRIAPGIVGMGRGDVRRTNLVDLPALSSAEQLALETASGLESRDLVIERGFLSNQIREGDYVLWTLILGGVVLTVVGIVISAAFAVGARRQLVTLGQLSASGASPPLLRAVLVLQGTVTGAVGAIAGLVLAAGILTFGHDRFELLLNQRFGAYDVPSANLAKAVLLGVAAATLAALVPARTAARIPTLSALAGRRPQAEVPRRLVAGGLVAVVVGLGLLGVAIIGGRGEGGEPELWAYVGIAGGVLELLGACAVAPALVARLEPLAGRLRGAWRMAARGLARNRARTGAVVSAVSAAGALAIVAGALVQGAEAQYPDQLEAAEDVVVAFQWSEAEVPRPERPDLGPAYVTTRTPPSAETRADLEEVLPDATVTTVRTATPPGALDAYWDVMSNVLPDGSVMGFSYHELVVADDAVLDAVGASAADRRVLEEVGLVQLVAVDGGDPVVAALDPSADGLTFTLDGTSIVVDHAFDSLSNLLITEALAEDVGFEVREAATLYRLPTDVTRPQSNSLSDIAYGGASDGQGSVVVSWGEPDTGPSPFQLELLLTGLALVFALFVVGASLALAAAESKDERDILTIAGAPPGLLARAAGARAWILAGLGGLLAIPVGFLPVVVFTRASAQPGDTPFPLVFPSRTALLLVLVVPTIVMVAARAASATAQRLRPVRVSTATFE